LNFYSRGGQVFIKEKSKVGKGKTALGYNYSSTKKPAAFRTSIAAFTALLWLKSAASEISSQK
jgi:hypothetical protein